MSHLIFTLAALTVAAPAIAQDEEPWEEFYAYTDPSDPKLTSMVLQETRRQALDTLADHPGFEGHEHFDWAKPGALLDMLGIDLEVIDFGMEDLGGPDGTGIIDPMDLPDDLPGTDGLAAAGMPTGEGLASTQWSEWRSRTHENGTTTLTRAGVNPEAETTHYQQSVVVPGGATISAGEVTIYAGGEREIVEAVAVEGGYKVTATRRDAAGDIVESTTEVRTGKIPVPADSQPVEDDWSGGGYCPLIYAGCQLALERFQADAGRPSRIIAGSALINPSEDAYLPTAPRLILDGEDLVIDPDAQHDDQSQFVQPHEMDVYFEALVLPPRDI